MGVWNKKRGRRNKIAEIAVHANTGKKSPKKKEKGKKSAQRSASKANAEAGWGVAGGGGV